jgi:hypothetical protein
MLFIDADGFGIYETAYARTLYDAAGELADALAPRMALNLDMGSYDYCQDDVVGQAVRCGALARDDTGKLSNLLVLTLH